MSLKQPLAHQEDFCCINFIIYTYIFFSLTQEFPKGKPKVLYGDEIEQVTYENNIINVRKKPVHGLIQLSVVCPSNLKNPFLLIKNKNGQSVAPTCFLCGFKSLTTHKINTCKHTEIQRAIYGTYCISEINYALSLNYKILKVFSIYFYKETACILKDFISLLGFDKVTNSGFPSGFEENQYCHYLNEKMDFKSIGLIVKPENIKDDTSKRTFAKLALNSFLGKFSQRNDKSQSILVRNEDEIAKYFYSRGHTINDIFAINKHFCQIEVKRTRLSMCPPSKNTNCIIGAYIVALSRQIMHQHMIDLELVGAQLMYTDTDCLIFSLKKWLKNPLPISNCFGDFKFEIEEKFEIQSYYSLGPKNFSILYKDNKDNLHTLVKLRGITLSNAINSDTINAYVYDNFLESILRNKKIKISIPQVRKKRSKRSRINNFKFTKAFFSNSISAKRVINKNCPNFSSYPYGFLDL